VILFESIKDDTMISLRTTRFRVGDKVSRHEDADAVPFFKHREILEVHHDPIPHYESHLVGHSARYTLKDFPLAVWDWMLVASYNV
jgi:hypothetical protein